MSPSIDAGAVVLVSDVPADRIEREDVITYVESENAGSTTRVTHRVVDIETADDQLQFRTKGDANDNPDEQLVAASNVVGVVQFHVPLIGYLIAFAGSTTGLVTLVVVPATLLVVSEMWSLYTDVTESEEGETS
ncbi:signal peptidase I [Halorhabdus tiamatea SARL4B]|nr:signal peptidase I [Halorhabdus tiamatea SARL4B]